MKVGKCLFEKGGQNVTPDAPQQACLLWNQRLPTTSHPLIAFRPFAASGHSCECGCTTRVHTGTISLDI